MSEDNVEATRRGIEHYNRRDIDRFLELADPDIEWFSAFAALEGGVFRGHEGVIRYFDEIAVVWEEFELIPIRFVEDGEAVVVDIDVRGRGKGSGVAIDTPISMVLWFRDGRAYRGQTFLDRRAARVAAGLDDV